MSSKKPIRKSADANVEQTEPARPGAKEKKERHDKDAGKQRSIDGNQGEGNKEADRRYREGLAKFEESGKVAEKAKDARRALESTEGEELRAAASKARKGKS